MEPALIGEKNGKPGDEQVLLVRRDSGIRGLDQLRGGKLTLLQGAGGEIASLWLDNLLAKRGLPAAGRMFGSVKVVPKAQQVILPVFFRQADGCIVGSNAFQTAVELNPQLGKELVAMRTSPVYPIAVTCLRTTLTNEQKDRVHPDGLAAEGHHFREADPDAFQGRQHVPRLRPGAGPPFVPREGVRAPENRSRGRPE